MLTTPRKYLSYDPARDTEASFWVALTGSISASGADLTVNADTLISLETFSAGVLKVEANIPADPTSGDDRKIGFTGQGTGAYAWFFVDGAALKCQVSDGDGNTATETISWSDGVIEDFSGNVATYEIRWDAGIVRFFINGVQRAQLSTGVPTGLMSVYLHNANVDNLLVKQVTVDGR
jgi:hypothetical protein